MSKRGWRLLQATAGILVVGFVSWYLVRNWDAVRRSPVQWRFHPGWILISLLLVLATYGILIESWRRMLAGWGPLLRWWDAARIWVLSSMGKYIPGKVWAIAGMALMAQQRGVPAWAATASAVVLQIVSIATGALIVGVTGMTALEVAHPGLRFGLGVLLGGSVVGLVAMLWPPLSARLVRLVSSGEHQPTTPRAGAIIFGMAANALAWVTYGAALWLLARGTIPSAGLGLGESVGAFAASYIAGLLFLLAPGGLGVRESVFVVMLEPRIGLANALALAAVSRLGMTGADVLAALPFVRAFKETARHAV